MKHEEIARGNHRTGNNCAVSVYTVLQMSIRVLDPYLRPGVMAENAGPILPG